jgi:hypothetical protein
MRPNKKKNHNNNSSRNSNSNSSSNNNNNNNNKNLKGELPLIKTIIILQILMPTIMFIILI